MIRHSRRNFLAVTVALGVSQIFSFKAFAELSRQVDADGNLYSGPVATLLNHLLVSFQSGQMSNEEVLRQLRLRLSDFNLEDEFQEFTEDYSSPVVGLSRKTIKSGDWAWASKVQLFFLKPGKAHPPHAHERMTSYQTLIRGSLQLTEFQKIAQNENSLTLSSPQNQTLKAGMTFETTDDRNNVHWFGAIEPSIILNLHLHQKPRAETQDDSENRIYVDPRNFRQGTFRFEAPILKEEAAHAAFNDLLPFQIFERL